MFLPSYSMPIRKLCKRKGNYKLLSDISRVLRSRFGRILRFPGARPQPPRGNPPLRGLRNRAVPQGVYVFCLRLDELSNEEFAI